MQSYYKRHWRKLRDGNIGLIKVKSLSFIALHPATFAAVGASYPSGFIKVKQKLKISKWLMYLSVAVVLAFQAYWLIDVYKDNFRKLRREVAVVLREGLIKDQLQYFVGGGFVARPLLVDSVNTGQPAMVFIKKDSGTVKDPALSKETEKEGTTTGNRLTVVEGFNLNADTGKNDKGRQRGRILGFDTRRDGPESYTALTITLPVLPAIFDSTEMQNKYKQLLQESNLPHEFTLTKSKLSDFPGLNFRGQGRFNVNNIGEAKRDFVFSGADFHFGNPASYILQSMAGQVLFAILITAVLILSFRFIYGSLKEQWQLGLLKNELISNITHELKTPVATVSVALDALQNFHALNDADRTKEYLAISAAEMKRLALLIDKVLHFNMYEANKLELRTEPVNLTEITTEAIQSLKPQAQKLEVKLDVKMPAEEVWVKGDKLHLLSVVLNLLDNALKYRSSHPVITVELEQDTQHACWRIRDNGPGIAPEYKAKVFEKFFRVPSHDRHDVKGYGLGLSYVKDVVQKHGGNITVDSEPGKGSTFTVRIPAWSENA